MTDQHNDQWLDSLLQAEETGIEDAGFSQRVLDALPHAPLSEKTRFWILFSCALVAGIVSCFLLPSGQYVADAILKVFTPGYMLTFSIPSLAIVAMLIGSTIAVVRAEA